jgi:hypothetical protein
MNQLTINKPRNNHDPRCAGAMAMAERELAAFFSAVRELFGPELAGISAEEWLEELAATNNMPSSAREWRRITLNICQRLAARLSALSISECIAETRITP